MSTVILAKAAGYGESAVLELANGEVDTVMLDGGNDAIIAVQVEIATDNFRTTTQMRGIDPESCVLQIAGPIRYRTVRPNNGAEAGCTLLGTNASG